MHSEAIGLNRTPLVAVSYLGVAAVLFACSRYATETAPSSSLEGPQGELIDSAAA
jgi:hypothetical protein